MNEQQRQEIELKRTWLQCYLDSLKKQQGIKRQLEEERDRATSIHSTLNSICSAPTGTHSDHVGDAVQRITALEECLQHEQQRGVQAAAEIMAAICELPLRSFQVLSYQYIDGMTRTQIAQELQLSTAAIAKYRREGFELLKIPTSK